MKGGHVLASLPAVLPSEVFETLVKHSAVRIEQILSKGHTSPDSGWYDQDEHEWVIVLRGRGRLEFDDGEAVTLDAGGWIEIPAHRRHRVAWTDPDDVTVWLAVFYRDPG
ncbi:cupin domain-containing protein [Candidatus Binatia bacterium]|nr:cupin domain-containing protein [Candidatus Binatia bacterium]